MTYGLQVWDSVGSIVFDSTAADGGVPVGVYSGGAGTLSFPQFAGYTMAFLTISGAEWEGQGIGVSISHAAGYPVVTVSTWAPTFLLAIF